MRLRNITLLCEHALFILILVHKGIRVESSVVVNYRGTPSIVLRAMEPSIGVVLSYMSKQVLKSILYII
jgi:hypothetical protein